MSVSLSSDPHAATSSPPTFYKLTKKSVLRENDDRPVFLIEDDSLACFSGSNFDDDYDVDEGLGKFIECCFMCEKKIKDSDDIYMYSYLHAFCSKACRDKQIRQDGLATMRISDEDVAILANMCENNGTNRFGANTRHQNNNGSKPRRMERCNSSS